ncbi:dehydrogenase/reductase SDR family member 7 [Tanacetum coccineum]
MYPQQATLDGNVMGPISLTRLLLPHMLKRGRGHFVVMSSAAGKVPAPGQAVYSASKFALNGYFHSLRSEFYQKGIMVTVVCPGPIETSVAPDTSTSGQKGVKEKRVSSERCARAYTSCCKSWFEELGIISAVLVLCTWCNYLPSVGFWVMDKVGAKRVEAAAQKGNTLYFDKTYYSVERKKDIALFHPPGS